MGKEKEKETPPETDPDETFFKEHGVEDDEDKAYLKSAYLREKYLEHRRASDEKPKSKKKGLFGSRRD